MKVITDQTASKLAGNAHVVTIGSYDGLHIGHRMVIDVTQKAAQRLAIDTAVVTFDPHPGRLLKPESPPLMLVNRDQKLELLQSYGVDTVRIVGFDRALSQLSPAGFVKSLLVDELQAKKVVVGRDFRFGKGRSGDLDRLLGLGLEYGFEIFVVDLVEMSGKVSSSSIRQLVAAGDVVAAARLLGRNYELRGPVVYGDQRGRIIGFPTANVAVALNMAYPADGVYAGWYQRPDGTRYKAAINIGKRPTFQADLQDPEAIGHSVVEAHLLDFDGDLYDEQAKVFFVQRLRSERKFDGLEALREQLVKDIAKVDVVLQDQSDRLA